MHENHLCDYGYQNVNETKRSMEKYKYVGCTKIMHCIIKVREYRRGNQKGQSRETGNIGYTRRRKKIKTNTICVGHHYA